MPRENYADVTILLDRSGSMASCREGAVSGVNGFIADQKSVPGDGCWTLFTFDDHHHAAERGEQFPHAVYSQMPQSQVRPLTAEQFVPRGNTALNDALAHVIDATGRRLASLPEHMRPSLVLVVVMTDGYENQSKNYPGPWGKEQVRARIAHQRDKYNWRFVFLGANMDAVAVGTSYGAMPDACFTYEHSNAGADKGFVGFASARLRSWKPEGNDTAASLHVPPAAPPGAKLPGEP